MIKSTVALSVLAGFLLAAACAHPGSIPACQGRLALTLEAATHAADPTLPVAVAITGGSARALGCEPGSPGLEITRHYSDPAGRPFVITISVQPADRFSYVIKLTRLGRHAAAAGAAQSA